MSQEDVLRTLELLGGRATLGNVRRELRRRYPDRSLCETAYIRLARLRKQGRVLKEGQGRATVWILKEREAA